MTELEKIERAKTYMDKLANGINPLDDSMVPEAELINNVHLSRCFFFISDVLRQVIANSGTLAPVNAKKTAKVPLEISFEKREQFAYSNCPIPASEIARRINKLANQENMQKLTYADIIAWLTNIEMMEKISASSGKRLNRPTPWGIESGISVELRTGSRGSYEVVVYDIAAQHFIVDNLDAILAEKEKSRKLTTNGCRWWKNIYPSDPNTDSENESEKGSTATVLESP